MAYFITTRTELTDRILQDLGEPTIKVNVDPIHIENAIDDAVEQFWQYHRDGSKSVYVRVPLTQAQIDNAKVTLPDTITDVIEILGIGAATKGFATVEWQTQASLMDTSRMAFLGLGDYVATRAMFTNTQYIMNSVPHHVFRKYQHEIEFTEGLGVLQAGDFLVIEAHENQDPEEEYAIYGEPWIREYATAKVRKVWGDILKKYGGMTLPGGLQLDGDKIADEGKADIERLEEKLKEEMQAPPVFYIG